MPIEDNEMMRMVLVEEVTIHAEMALFHYEYLEAYLADVEQRQRREVWAHLQAFLMHTGLISKLANPPSSAAAVRGNLVCRLFGIEGGSSIFDRAGRNNVEHFDERLDLWLNDTSRCLLEIVLPDEASFQYFTARRPLARQPKIRRVLLLDTMTFISEGRTGPERTDLIALRNEVERIRSEGISRLHQMASNPSRRVVVVSPRVGLAGSAPKVTQE